VTHAIYPVSQGLKFALLLALLEKTNFNSVLVFTRTKHGADKIALRLKEAGHSVAVLHGNRSQGQRTAALKGFKDGQYEVMVATDIAARGIDVAGVSHVINYDIPMTPDDYVHRIGRTGRAAAVGDAFTLATPQEANDVRQIERFIKATIPQLKLEGFDYKAVPAAATAGESDFRGGRRQPQGRGRGRSGGGGRTAAAHHPKGKPGGHWHTGGRH